MNTMIRLRERGQISESMSRQIALNECYREATTTVLRALSVTDGDLYFANEQQAEMARAAGEAACQKLQAKFKAIDEAIAEESAQNAEAERVNTVVRVLSGNLIGVTTCFSAEEIGFFNNGEWVTCFVYELTDSNKESLLNAVTKQCKEWAAEFLTTKAVVIETDSFIFVDADDNNTLYAEELKAARKATKQAEKAAKIAAKKGRI